LKPKTEISLDKVLTKKEPESGIQDSPDISKNYPDARRPKFTTGAYMEIREDRE